jgi:8-oxo-dGTP diphosphatase
MKLAFGGVLVNDQGQVLLRRVTNDFGGYRWTYPKGRPDPGETPEQAALRETLEEVGYQAEIVCLVHSVVR